jgi:hypothetical protein
MGDLKLTEAMVEVGDCRTTLYYFLKEFDNPSMRFTDAAKYNELHEEVWYGLEKFSEFSEVTSPAVLKNIATAYHPNKYWFTATGLDNIANFPFNAWEHILPLECTLKERIEIDSNGFTFKISPRPRVLLYPFGWTTKLSIRITKDHSLEQLSRFIQHVVNQPCIRIKQPVGTAPIAAMRLKDFFARIAAGVRTDVFEGDKSDQGSRDTPVIVTTVIAKSGISPTSQPDPDLLKLMLRMVTPEGNLPTSPFSDHVFLKDPDDTLQFVVSNNHGRFIWIEKLLKNDEHKRLQLLCHHNNSFQSLVHAIHLAELIERAVQQKKKSKAAWSDSLMGLLVEAENQLAEPRYKNASQRIFLKDTESAIKKFNALIDQSYKG